MAADCHCGDYHSYNCGYNPRFDKPIKPDSLPPPYEPKHRKEKDGNQI